tara:strand:- start:1325 stop:1549 length:225 start_codon:yes stop_codon:yes gene_type:complete
MTEPHEDPYTQVTFTVDREFKQRLRCIPWGLQGKIFRNLAVRVCEMIENRGEIMLGALLSGEFEIKYKKKTKRN